MENPKVGYSDNFSKIREQAVNNPDVNYLVGPEHHDSVVISGLTNIEVNENLSESNISANIEGFNTHSESFLVQKSNLVDSQNELTNFSDSLESGSELVGNSLIVLNLAMAGARQYQLVKNGDVSCSEAALNTVTKMAVKYGSAKGGGMAGAMAGGMVGGPVGAIIGGVIGCVGGSSLGNEVYAAWKSGDMMKSYISQTHILQKTSMLCSEDFQVKINQANHYDTEIKIWMWKNFLHVLWPSENYVLRKHMASFIVGHAIMLNQSSDDLQIELENLKILQVKFKDSGFFSRLLGSTEGLEKEINESSSRIFGIAGKCGVLRVEAFKEQVKSWEDHFNNVKREKRKLAA